MLGKESTGIQVGEGAGNRIGKLWTEKGGEKSPPGIGMEEKREKILRSEKGGRSYVCTRKEEIMQSRSGFGNEEGGKKKKKGAREKKKKRRTPADVSLAARKREEEKKELRD